MLGQQSPRDPSPCNQIQYELLDQFGFHLFSESILLLLAFPFVDQGTDIFCLQPASKIQRMHLRQPNYRSHLLCAQKVAVEHRQKDDSRLKGVRGGYLKLGSAAQINMNGLLLSSR
jgi:hypothetical protein